MKHYKIKVVAYASGSFDREYDVKAGDFNTAASTAIKEFFSEPINKKRKRKVTQLTLIIKR